ncbi:unnamed protein product [Cylicocyclus nassatus]|uniref:Uncharacterized protein n=1 Tax=Cylicocyclus nassatus TaxID=53992 RepID=A0AA36GQ89_CYLNA|nr:unnamed protein product [Cylicocyclus nassatus]
MVHPDKTIMEKTLAKSRHLVKLRGVLYEPKCGDPMCFHDWFKNRDHNSNPVREHIQLFDDIYPIVRDTIAANLAEATDRRKLLNAYRVYCHQVFAKVATDECDTEIHSNSASEISTLRWWIRNAIALAEKPFPGIKEFEDVFITHCSAKYDGRGFFFITRHKGASIVVRLVFYVGLQEEEQWHASVTTTSVIIGEDNLRRLIKEAIARKMSLCEFIELVLWPFVDFLNSKKVNS